nr:MAG TPA: hypothetical protein [Caudoviricetes sp.]
MALLYACSYFSTCHIVDCYKQFGVENRNSHL